VVTSGLGRQFVVRVVAAVAWWFDCHVEIALLEEL